MLIYLMVLINKRQLSETDDISLSNTYKKRVRKTRAS